MSMPSSLEWKSVTQSGHANYSRHNGLERKYYCIQFFNLSLFTREGDLWRSHLTKGVGLDCVTPPLLSGLLWPNYLTSLHLIFLSYQPGVRVAYSSWRGIADKPKQNT